MSSLSPRPFTAAIAVACTLLAPLAALSADWPQWRGPNRDGRSAETGLLQAWPEGGPPLAWRADGLGAGFSSVAVVGERIYTMGDLEDGQYVFGLAEADGTLLWKTKVGPIHEDEYGGSRSTPTTDGERLYVVTTEGAVVCLATETGEEIWRLDMVAAYDSALMKAKGSWDWKFAESPLVDGDRVIVTPGQKSAMLIALDKATGAEIWKTVTGDLGDSGEDGAAYSSAVVTEIDGTRQYVQLVGRGVVGVDAESGELLWSYNRVANGIANIPTSLVTGDYVFTSTGYGTGAALLRIVREEPSKGADEAPGWRAEEIYFLDGETMQNHHGGLILHDGHVFTGTGHNKGFPLAVELETGEIAWGPIRNDGQSSAAITYADGRIYFRYQNGLMILVEASPEAYREHGSFPIPDVRKPSWSHPVVANGRLYLKEQGTLLSYDVAQREEVNPAAGSR